MALGGVEREGKSAPAVMFPSPHLYQCIHARFLGMKPAVTDSSVLMNAIGIMLYVTS